MDNKIIETPINIISEDDIINVDLSSNQFSNLVNELSAINSKIDKNERVEMKINFKKGNISIKTYTNE